jgi:Ran GTPase-activating protein (RanGAP) involved in mRNA processing and transport
VWELCLERERLLREVGFSDAYAHVKHNENKAALCLLPALLRVRKTDACEVSCAPSMELL